MKMLLPNFILSSQLRVITLLNIGVFMIGCRSKENSEVKKGLGKLKLKQTRDQAKQKIRLCGFNPGAAITFNICVASTGRVLSEAQPLRPHKDTPLRNCAAKVVNGIPFTAITQESTCSHKYSIKPPVFFATPFHKLRKPLQ